MKKKIVDVCEFDSDNRCVGMRLGGMDHCCVTCSQQSETGCKREHGKPLMCGLWFCKFALDRLGKKDQYAIKRKYTSMRAKATGNDFPPWWRRGYLEEAHSHLLVGIKHAHVSC